MKAKVKGRPRRPMLKFVGKDGKELLMLPAGPDRCETCNWIHRPDLPHNRETVFYQMRFYYENGYRWPTWNDAAAHCTPEIRADWFAALAKVGIKVDEPVPEPRQGTINVSPYPGVSLDVSVSIGHNTDATPADIQAAADALEVEAQSEFVASLKKEREK